MAGPNYGAAAQQTMLMLQKVNKDVQLVESLDTGLDKMFSSVGPGDEIGLQNYRLPLQMETGGVGGFYQPDGGSYPQGTGPQYDQMILAPQPIILAFTVTELSRRISKAGMDVTAKNYVAKMISDAKKKASHFRNAYLQGYNNGLLATVDATYAGGTTVPLASAPFGGRLINRGDQLQATDANFNVIGQVNVLDITKNAIGTPDVMTIDVAPGGLAVGYNFIPFGLASGNPIGLNGLKYLVSPAVTGELCGIARANSYVQAPAWNANAAPLTNAGVEIFLARMEQALGADRFAAGSANNKWYGHQAQYTSAKILGFGKMTYFTSDGKAPSGGFDIATSTKSARVIAGCEFISDSMAAIDALYFLDKSTLKRVRYPDSEKFLPGPLEGMFWPRIAGGLYSSQSDILYQDSTNYTVNNPWANGVMFGLTIQAGFSN